MPPSERVYWYAILISDLHEIETKSKCELRMDLNAEMDLNECEIDLYVCEDFLKVNMDLSEIDPEV